MNIPRLATFVELHPSAQEFFHHVMRDSPSANMFNDDFHLRVIRETSVLLFEAKVGGMKMQNKRRWTFGVFLQYIRRRFNYGNASVNACGMHTEEQRNKPYGSGGILATRRSNSAEVLVEGLCGRDGNASPGF